MTELIKICAAALIALIAAVILKAAKMPNAEIIALVFIGIVSTRLIFNLEQTVALIKNMSEETAVLPYLEILFKALGIALITDFTSDLCKNAGEGMIAEYVGLAGRSEIMLLSLPLIRELMSISTGLVG
ncbi:MAG: hypothetical protein HFE30_02135 [Clostridiales bacterium]|nr:hypothetical protein [Clostridiales bacterium]